MPTYSLAYAEEHFEILVDRAALGEEVVVRLNDQEAVELRPLSGPLPPDRDTDRTIAPPVGGAQSLSRET